MVPAAKHRAAVHRPGKPDQNAFIERFNRTYRDEVLDQYVLESVEQVQLLTHEWLTVYNTERPHDSLGRVPSESPAISCLLDGGAYEVPSPAHAWRRRLDGDLSLGRS